MKTKPRMRKWLRTLLIIAGFFVSLKIYNADPFGNSQPNVDPLIIAHRGASGHAPENSLAAINKAIELGAPVIEIDVHLTEDGEVVLMHDPTLDRCSNGSGPIIEKSLAELKQLDIGSWFDPRFSQERIPTLAAVLDSVRGRSKLLIELKWGEDGVYPALVDKCLALVREKNASDWVLMQSFDAGMVHELCEKAPELETYKLIFADIPILPCHIDRMWQWSNGSQFDCGVAVNPWLGMLNQRLVNRIHRSGKKVFVYTVNSEADKAWCAKLGVDGIITDFP